MTDIDAARFDELATSVLLRYARQNDWGDIDPATLRPAIVGLQNAIRGMGLPPPGARGELDDFVFDAILREIESAGPLEERWEHPVRQLAKACFYPERGDCCESYCETDKRGRCKRQSLEKGRERISGAHCVDCPHWTESTPEEHTALLEQAWQPGPVTFEEVRELFLPEDYRALRRFIRTLAAAR